MDDTSLSFQILCEMLQAEPHQSFGEIKQSLGEPFTRVKLQLIVLLTLHLDQSFPWTKDSHFSEYFTALLAIF